MAFTVTQFGLNSTLPIFEVGGGRHIALLKFYYIERLDTSIPVCLILRKAHNRDAGNQERKRTPVYYCSLLGDSRCILIPPEMASKLRWQSREIYIPMRPAYRSGAINLGTSITRLLVSSPERPYHITLPAVEKWERESGLVLSGIKMPPLPWTGSPEIILLFKTEVDLGSRKATIGIELSLGRCTSDHYAVVRCSVQKAGSVTPASVIGSLSSGPIPGTASHSCERDHLDTTRIPEFPAWVELPVTAGQCGAHTIQYRRFGANHAGLLLEVRFTRLYMDECEQFLLFLQLSRPKLNRSRVKAYPYMNIVNVDLSPIMGRHTRKTLRESLSSLLCYSKRIEINSTNHTEPLPVITPAPCARVERAAHLDALVQIDIRDSVLPAEGCLYHALSSRAVSVQ